MTCEKCGGHSEVRFVTFQQNIGLFVIRFPSQFQGNLCQKCIHITFWKMTTISMIAGWWGIISAFTNINFILNNIKQYAIALPDRRKVTQPIPRPKHQLHPIALARIEIHHAAIEAALESGTDLAKVCEEFSDKAMVPASDIRFYISEHLKRDIK